VCKIAGSGYFGIMGTYFDKGKFKNNCLRVKEILESFTSVDTFKEGLQLGLN